MRTTSNGFFKPPSDTQKLIDNTETAQELKERLIVAEKVMKSLFERNKQLEDGTVGVSEAASGCLKCSGMEQRILELESELGNMQKTP